MKYLDCKYKVVVDDLGFVIFMVVIAIVTTSFLWLLVGLLGCSIEEIE